MNNKQQKSKNNEQLIVQKKNLKIVQTIVKAQLWSQLKKLSVQWGCHHDVLIVSYDHAINMPTKHVWHQLMLMKETVSWIMKGCEIRKNLNSGVQIRPKPSKKAKTE